MVTLKELEEACKDLPRRHIPGMLKIFVVPVRDNSTVNYSEVQEDYPKLRKEVIVRYKLKEDGSVSWIYSGEVEIT